jgi:hypothetical protein
MNITPKRSSSTFCGGGVTAVEALGLGRKVVGVDVNPRRVRHGKWRCALDLRHSCGLRCGAQHGTGHPRFYTTSCPSCRADAVIEWTAFSGERLSRISYRCPGGHAGEKPPSAADRKLADRCRRLAERMVRSGKPWYPHQAIPPGDKTTSIIRKGYTHFRQLFTPRNLYALAALHEAIGRVSDRNLREFFYRVQRSPEVGQPIAFARPRRRGVGHACLLGLPRAA